MRHRLGIVVPYRDRQHHLDAFLPRLQEFFAHDATGETIDYRVLIVEQAPGLPFNQGALQNIGFRHLARDIDYVCFHDVDRLPVAADYRYPEVPAMIIFHGLPFKPDFIKQLFSSVILLQTAHFVGANGYSNDYWGWGFEDVDLRERLLRRGLTPTHREGTFTTLPHVDEGSHPDGSPTAAHRANQQLFISRWLGKLGPAWVRLPKPAHPWQSEGLNSVAFEPLHPPRVVQSPGPGGPLIEHVTVALPAPPTRPQLPGGTTI